MYDWRQYFRTLRWILLGCVAVVLVMDILLGARFLPPHQGELTMAEFAENYNHQAALIGRGCGSLDENGQLREESLMFFAQKRGAPYYWEDVTFSYELDGEYVQAVTITGHLAVCPPEYWGGDHGRPQNLPATRAAVGALAWAQEEASPLNLLRQTRLGLLKWRGLTDYNTGAAGVRIANQAVSTEGMGEYDMTFTLRLSE